MPTTTYASTNAFNLAETAAVATISGDAWLGSATNVKTVHAKIRTGEDIFVLYYPYELPAIGVQALGGGGDGKNTMGEFEILVSLGFDCWATGTTFTTADTTIKEIVARLRRLLRLQAFSPAVNAGSSALNGLLINGTIDVERADFEHFPAKDGGWLVHSVTFANLTIISED